MSAQEPLYLGFDLSTQQLKGLAVTSDLKVVHEAKFDFDADSKGFNIKKGVITDEEEHEVYAPVALWLQALDALMTRLKDKGIDFSRVRGISGSGQQHGSVYWSEAGEHALQNLDSGKTLEDQLDHAFSHPFSPNWQDASTQKECDAFDAELGGPQHLADRTGSKAHHVGPHCASDTMFQLTYISSASPALRSFGSKGDTTKHTTRLPGSPWSPPFWPLSSSVKLLP